jgi:hypothetical protein
MKRALDEVTRRFKPSEVALTAPTISPSIAGCLKHPSDHYYRLDLSALSVPQKLRNMLRRAGQEISVERVKNFDREHRQMVNNFLNSHPIDGATQLIFEKIPEYMSASNTAWAFDARNRKGELVAFDVAEFGPRHYALYMFNFSSRSRYVPGASDILLAEVIRHAKAEHKRYINLGLGINPGVIFFKKKWGGVPLLPYSFCLYTPSRVEILETLLQKL